MKHLDPAYRAALVVCAVLNALMFFAEGAVGLTIGSAALLADAVDFLEDATVYSLAVIALGWGARHRALAGLFMGFAMLGVGLVALAQVADTVLRGGAPAAAPMGATALAALAVNVYCASRIAPFKRGDASMRSIWLSSRNDAILNVLTLGAAAAVAALATGWPDVVAGLIIAGVNLAAAVEVLGHARRELREAR